MDLSLKSISITLLTFNHCDYSTYTKEKMRSEDGFCAGRQRVCALYLIDNYSDFNVGGGHCVRIEVKTRRNVFLNYN